MRIRDDAVGELVGFARRLRADGLAVDLGRVAATLRALASYGVLGSDDLYWSTRLTCALGVRTYRRSTRRTGPGSV